MTLNTRSSENEVAGMDKIKNATLCKRGNWAFVVGNVQKAKGESTNKKKVIKTYNKRSILNYQISEGSLGYDKCLARHRNHSLLRHLRPLP